MTSLKDPRVRQYIEAAVGENGMKLVDLLESKHSATDTELSEELGEKPSHIRKILYNLYEARIAEYQKEKDKETGWLTFHWHITPEAAQYAIEQKRRRELGKLEEALRTETSNDWYICPDGHERFNFTHAAELNFSCPEHGSALDHHDNQGDIRALEARIRELKEFDEQHRTAPT